MYTVIAHLEHQKEEIIANDNQLKSLPKSIDLRLFVLSVLDLRNNRLTTLNTELSRLVSRGYELV